MVGISRGTNSDEARSDVGGVVFWWVGGGDVALRSAMTMVSAATGLVTGLVVTGVAVALVLIERRHSDRRRHDRNTKGPG